MPLNLKSKLDHFRERLKSLRQKGWRTIAKERVKKISDALKEQLKGPPKEQFKNVALGVVSAVATVGLLLAAGFAITYLGGMSVAASAFLCGTVSIRLRPAITAIAAPTKKLTYTVSKIATYVGIAFAFNAVSGHSLRDTVIGNNNKCPDPQKIEKKLGMNPAPAKLTPFFR